MKRFKKFKTLSLCLLLLGGSIHAAEIKWGSPLSINDLNDVISFLPVDQAWNAGGKTNIVVNGVTFSADPGIINPLFFEGFTPKPTLPSIPPEYQILLNTGCYEIAEVNLKNLKPGRKYTIQIWINDTRDFTAVRSRRTILSTPGGRDAILKQSSDDAGTLGQFVVGTFTADSTKQVIEVIGLENDNIVPSASVINAVALYRGTLSD